MVGASDADGVRELTPWLVQVIGGSAAHLQGTSQLRFSPTQSAIRAASKKCLQLINTRRYELGKSCRANASVGTQVLTRHTT
eukprot:1922137-Pyramimonas_sp.AAC.1